MMMKRIFNDVKFVVRPGARWFLPLAVWLAGCSSIYDPATTPKPETDVRNYYLPLSTPKMEYDYTVVSTAPYHPASGNLTMNMLGNTDTVQNMPVYSCLWTYSNHFGTPEQWFYGLCDSEAVAMGLEPTQDHYTDFWVDLKANSASPLQVNATWSFISQGEEITAKVTAYGTSAQVEGKDYQDVMMVTYTGVAGTAGTEWFARGIGPIFYHVERPNFGMVENHLLSYEQR